MTSAQPPVSPYSRAALMALFFNAGMIYASWGVQVPFVKSRFDLDAAQLSMALLAVAIGSIVALTRVGDLLARVSGRRACAVAGWAIAITTASILLMPTYLTLCLALLAFGAANATMDVAINAEASALESAAGRPIMSSLHGMFSAGGIAGAALGGVLLAHGVSPLENLCLMACAALLISAIASRALSNRPHPAAAPSPEATDATAHPADAAGLPEAPATRSKRLQRVASRHLWALGGVALIALVAEGAMYDWSAVYMRDALSASPALSSAAYATFSTGMALGRFGGDAIRARTGDARLLLVSGLLAAVGMSAALGLHRPMAALAGFTFMGLGLANMIPVLFAAAGKVTGFTASRGIARVAGMAYVGMMAGPVLVGMVTQLTNLSAGLAVVALGAALVGASGAWVLRRGIATV